MHSCGSSYDSSTRPTKLNFILVYACQSKFDETPHHLCEPGLPKQSSKQHWRSILDEDTLSLPRTLECFQTIEMDPKLRYKLPKRQGMLAGQVLKHCYQVIDNLLESQKPCVFKAGYTHCPHFRFYNKMYGYINDVVKWEEMIVIHAASETISCSFIEAAIIQRHKGILN